MGLPVEVNPLFLENQYAIQRSLRFRSSATAYLSRTPSSTSNQQKFVMSVWVKLGSVSSYMTLLSANGSPTTAYTDIRFGYLSGDMKLNFDVGPDATRSQNYTTATFRDPSSWYHVVVAIDTTQATAANRLLMYVNGVSYSYTSSASIPLNLNTNINLSGTAMGIGRRVNGSDLYFDGYMSEYNFIDGLSFFSDTSGTANPNFNISSFGQYNEFGVWSPRKYGGAYGTNGFYLPFNDPTSATTLCYDRQLGYTDTSKNNWTPNNISTTAGTTYDAMTDVPPPSTIQNVRAGNYATGNPIAANTATSWSVSTMQAANLNWGDAASNLNRVGVATIAMPNGYGKWYWEVTIGSNFPATNTFIGMSKNNTFNLSKAIGIFYRNDGQKVIDGTASAYGSSYTAGDVIGLAYDATTGTLTCYKNNTSQGALYSSGSGFDWLPNVTCDNAGVGVTYFNSVNFGQRPFANTTAWATLQSSGYNPLNSNNLPAPTIPNGAKVMAAVLYGGNGSTQTVTTTSTNSGNNPLGTAFQPDLVWIKSRNATTYHQFVDVVRGISLPLFSNVTTAETLYSTFSVTSFNVSGVAGGISVSDNAAANYGVNGSTGSPTYVAWEWNAGTGLTTPVPSGGTITPTGASVNVGAGFSIISYTGTGSNATVPHGLNVAPAFIIIKDRGSSTNGGVVYHTSLGATQYLQLFITTTGTNGAATDNTMFNGGSPTFNSSVFSVGTNVRTNTTDNYIAYCWTPISGYSSFGQYSGNSSADGSYVYLGFRPRWLMIKGIGSGGSGWMLLDTSRDTYNVDINVLRPDLSAAESTGYGGVLDILSNGFKLRSTDTNSNSSSTTYGPYIYAAFAENPFKLALAR